MNIGAMIESWSNVLFHPGEPAFVTEREKAQATLTTAFIWILIAAVVNVILGWLSLRTLLNAGDGSLQQLMTTLNLPPEMQTQMQSMIESGAMGGSSIISILISPILFLIVVGILYLIARLFGGRGLFGRYAYLIAAFQAPITILNAVLNFIPVAGACLALGFSLYSIVLLYFATKVEHGLSSGRALIVVLIPVLLIILLMFCLVAFAASMFIATTNS